MEAPARILLVDDDPISLRILRKALETSNLYEVRTAADGIEGLAEALSFRPDLIISDKVMPRMDGLEFCQRVKSDPSLTSTIFVILSSVADPGARLEGLDQGADDFLIKPLPFEELQVRVRNFLQRRSPVGSTPAADHDPTTAVPLSQITQMLIHLNELMFPESANRGIQMAAASEWVAENLNLEPTERTALRCAASLQEIGKITLHSRLAGLNPTEISDHDRGAYRSYAGISYQVLRHIPLLERAAVLIRHQFENWDGSGAPDHLQQGRIPFGSRILRVLVDFFHDLDRVRDPSARARLIETLQLRVGTIYDPAAFASLAQYAQSQLGEDLLQTRRHVRVDELQAGMRLAADLVSASGTLLLRENEILTTSVVAGIQRHHSIEPFLFAVPVYPG